MIFLQYLKYGFSFDSTIPIDVNLYETTGIDIGMKGDSVDMAELAQIVEN